MTTLSLYNGDCLTVMKDLSGGSVDLIICDLPYGCLTNKPHEDGTEGKSKGGKNYSANTGCAWDIPIDLEAFWKEVKRIRRNEHTPCIHFCTTKFGIDLINSNPSEFRYDLVWDKQRGVSFLSANKMPMRSHEMVYVFSKEGANYYRKDIEVAGAKECKQYGKVGVSGVYGLVRDKPVVRPIGTITSKEGKRCVLSVIHNPTSKSKGGHPTAKPLELYKWLIERYSQKGGTVLDPTFGSGNSGQASWELDRSYIGIEKDKDFYDEACKKLISET